MNYLQLCQRLARESGSVNGGSTQPNTVLNQSGRLAKLVAWLSEDWVDFQNSRKDWLFLRKRINAVSLIVGNNEYGAASFALTDLGGWIDMVSGAGRDRVYSIYDGDIGPSDEGYLRFMPYDEFDENFLRGQQDNNRPSHFSVSPDNQLLIGPKPDKAYKMNGIYRRKAQVLAANDDTPIVEEDHHPLLVHLSLEHANISDEAFSLAAGWQGRLEQQKSNFINRYTPPMGGRSGQAGSPLA